MPGGNEFLLPLLAIITFMKMVHHQASVPASLAPAVTDSPIHQCTTPASPLVIQGPEDAELLHQALLEWARVPGGCHGEVRFDYSEEAYAGKPMTLAIPGLYQFHGRNARLTLSSSSSANRTTIIVQSSKGFQLFSFTNGATIHANNIGFQGGRNKWGGAIEILGGGRSNGSSNSSSFASSSSFRQCYYGQNQAYSLGGAVLIGGGNDIGVNPSSSPQVIFTDCTFEGNQAMQGGAIYLAPHATARSSSALVVLEACTFQENQAWDDGGALYVAATLLMRGHKNQFISNKANHREGNVYVDYYLGGKIIHEGDDEKKDKITVDEFTAAKKHLLLRRFNPLK